ncbi:MAG: hypothetical protein WC441_05465, partial [Patescibacteria group bacterium]
MFKMAIHEGLVTGQYEGKPFTSENAIGIIKEAQNKGVFDDTDIDRFKDKYPQLRDGLNGVIAENITKKIDEAVTNTLTNEVTNTAQNLSDVPINEPAGREEELPPATASKVKKLQNQIAKQEDYLARNANRKGETQYEKWAADLEQKKARLEELTKQAEEMTPLAPAKTSTIETPKVKGAENVQPGANTEDVLMDSLMSSDGTDEQTKGAFNKAGYVEVDGFMVHPDVNPEWVRQLKPETKANMRENGIFYIDSEKGEGAAGRVAEIQAGNRTLRGMQIKTKAGLEAELYTKKDEEALHETGHHVWRGLTDEQRKQWSAQPRITEHGKSVEAGTNKVYKYDKEAAAEEDFAQAYAENGGQNPLTALPAPLSQTDAATVGVKGKAGESLKEPWEMTREEYSNKIGADKEKLDVAKMANLPVGDIIAFPNEKIIATDKNAYSFTNKNNGKKFDFDIITTEADNGRRRIIARYSGTDTNAAGLIINSEGQVVNIFTEEPKIGLAQAILKKAQQIEPNLKPPNEAISKQGAKAAHRYYTEQALSEGKPVPESVLKDYPELQKKETDTFGDIPKVQKEQWGKYPDKQLKEFADKGIPGAEIEIAKRAKKAEANEPKEIFIRAAERRDLSRVQKSLKEIPDKFGYEKVYQKKGKQGRGFYYVKMKVKEVKAEKQEPAISGAENLVTFLQRAGKVRLGEEFQDKTGDAWSRAHGFRSKDRSREMGDIASVTSQNGKMAMDEAASFVNAEGFRDKNGDKFTDRTLFEALAAGEGRNILHPGKAERIIEKQIEEKENEYWSEREEEYLDQQREALAQEGIDATREIEENSESVRADLISEIEAEGNLTEEQLEAAHDEISSFFDEMSKAEETPRTETTDAGEQHTLAGLSAAETFTLTAKEPETPVVKGAKLTP